MSTFFGPMFGQDNWYAPCARSVHSRTVLVWLSWATCPSVTCCVSQYAPASKLNIKFGILTIIGIPAPSRFPVGVVL